METGPVTSDSGPGSSDGHPGDCGHVTTYKVLVRCGNLDIVDQLHQVQVLVEGRHWTRGHVRPDAVSGMFVTLETLKMKPQVKGL